MFFSDYLFKYNIFENFFLKYKKIFFKIKMYFNKKQKIFPDMNLKTETSHGEGDINLDSDRKHNEPLKRKTTKNNENLLSFFL